MRSRAHSNQPPRVAAWLIYLFAAGEQAEELLGDLLEEFSALESKSGAEFARSWYWRQTRKTIAHLGGTAFGAAPGRTAATVLGGLLLNWVVSDVPQRAIVALVTKYQVLERHFDAYVFLTTDGIAIGHAVVWLFVGCVVAWVAKGREMITTMALSLVLCAMTGAAVVSITARGRSWNWTMLPWYAAEWFAILIGGIIIRRLRAGRTATPLAT